MRIICAPTPALNFELVCCFSHPTVLLVETCYCSPTCKLCWVLHMMLEHMLLHTTKPQAPHQCVVVLNLLHGGLGGQRVLDHRVLIQPLP